MLDLMMVLHHMGELCVFITPDQEVERVSTWYVRQASGIWSAGQEALVGC
jgi:hypothetical protein